ncbi:MAG: ABC transporter permease [Nitrospinales bacterium]
MIRWIFQGVVRDKTRSLFPFLVVTSGVALMIFLIGFMEGIFMNMIDMTANLDTGHLRFVNKPFYDEEYLRPLDRALAAQKETLAWLKKNGDPKIQWSPRIRWSAIMDVPNEKGETLAQTPVTGLALDLLSPGSDELKRLKLDTKKALTQGRLPRAPKEALVGYQLARTLRLQLGKKFTLIGQTFDGGLAADNYTAVGFIKFGVFAMDKKMALIDLADAQDTFYMGDMVTDWLGFLPPRVPFAEYEKMKLQLESRLKEFQPPQAWAKDDVPIVKTIAEQRNIGALTRKFMVIKSIIVGIFLSLMVLVLWNAGLLNSIHRYGEIGLRLAMGETHFRLIAALLFEAFVVGALGCLAGSVVGGAAVYYLQEVGVDMGENLAKTGLMLSDVSRARMSLSAFIHGIVPGMTASVFGSLMAALAIFKRSEADLFRELEAG